MKQFKYKNPISADTVKNIRDPFIIFENGKYYLTGTTPPYWNGKSKGVMLWSSDDLLHFKEEKFILKRSDAKDDDWFRDYWWAPEIHKKNGKFFLTVNCRNDDLKIGQNPLVAVSEQINGEYKILNKKTPLVSSYFPKLENVDSVSGNDANLFTDDDNKTYISFCNNLGIFALEIDLENCCVKGKEISIVKPSENGWDTKIEAPFIFKHNKKYYCFYSSFTRSYEVGVSYSDNINGPWIKDERNPIIKPKGKIIQSGHNSVFIGIDDELWTAYHITLENQKDVQLLAYDKINFDDSGKILTSAPTLDTVTVEY
ncbi:MAG: family 43 glycosylhydrolase [Clostridiales bacterium]|nr:family 43 glycosylhydrolase [Clostridiales bacterium]